MNQMELNTHECLQFWLPQIAVALQDIAKELKKQNEQKDIGITSDSTNHDIFISKRRAFELMRDAGIPVRMTDYGDVLLNMDMIIGTNFAFLKVVVSDNFTIVTTNEDPISLGKLTKQHIRKFIEEYKTLEKELSK